MVTPRYVVQKIGSRYVPVPQEDPTTRGTWVGGGGVLAGIGLIRGGFVGMTAAVLGAGLIYRGLTGRNPLQFFCSSGCGQAGQGQGPSYQHDFERRAQQSPDDVVDEASMESFPASDSPSHTVTTKTSR